MVTGWTSEQTGIFKRVTENGNYLVTMIPEKHRNPREAIYNPKTKELFNVSTGYKWDKFIELSDRIQARENEKNPASIKPSLRTSKIHIQMCFLFQIK